MDAGWERQPQTHLELYHIADDGAYQRKDRPRDCNLPRRCGAMRGGAERGGAMRCEDDERRDAGAKPEDSALLLAITSQILAFVTSPPHQFVILLTGA